MVRKSLGVAHTKDLNGAMICLLTRTTLETNIADYNRQHQDQHAVLMSRRRSPPPMPAGATANRRWRFGRRRDPR